MQDRYVGDVGDFVKYGLLRAIRGTKRLGVAWYLHPNAGPPGDGKYTAYLQDPDEWRHLDPDLFDALRELTPDRRSVANIQQSGILGDAAFAADGLAVADVKVRDRERWRHQWFDGIKRQPRPLRSRLCRPRQRPRAERPLQAHVAGECEADSTS